MARWRHLPRLRWALAALCIMLVVDALNATHHYRHATQTANLLTWPAATDQVRQLVGWPQTGRYQALVPLPFFHTGTDTPDGGVNLNLDPDDPHCNTTYQLGMVTGLPLMTHKATRAITADAERLYSMFDPGGPTPDLLAHLDTRPILLFLDSAYYDGRNNYYRDAVKDRPEMRALFERTATFVTAQHLRRIGHQGSWSLYEWYPKGTTPAPR